MPPPPSKALVKRHYALELISSRTLSGAPLPPLFQYQTQSPSSHSQRHRRFGTVQPPDFSRLGISSSGGDVFSDRLRDLLNLEDEAVVGDIDSASGSSSLPQIFPPLIPSATTTSVAATSVTMTGNPVNLRHEHSPTTKKTHSNEVTLSTLSNITSSRGDQTRSVTMRYQSLFLAESPKVSSINICVEISLELEFQFVLNIFRINPADSISKKAGWNFQTVFNKLHPAG
ncbi:hypothetical protein ACTXT7_004357 [Hymenolepis weldensis]